MEPSFWNLYKLYIWHYTTGINSSSSVRHIHTSLQQWSKFCMAAQDTCLIGSISLVFYVSQSISYEYFLCIARLWKIVSLHTQCEFFRQSTCKLPACWIYHGQFPFISHNSFTTGWICLTCDSLCWLDWTTFPPNRAAFCHSFDIHAMLYTEMLFVLLKWFCALVKPAE